MKDDGSFNPQAAEERRRNRLVISQMHPGNRFRLMFGQPVFPNPEPTPTPMSTATLPPPPHPPPLTALAQAKAKDTPLDLQCPAYDACIGCLQTLSRMQLTARGVLFLLLLARRPELKLADLARELSTSTANITGITEQLVKGGLMTLSYGTGGDRRCAVIAITPAGSNVLASIVNLTGLAEASNILHRMGHKSNDQSRLEVAFPV